MAEFGAYSHFGTATFGGEPTWLKRYYDALRALEPPGVFSDEDTSLRNTMLKIDAKALELAQTVLDRVEHEIFPLTSCDLLPDWEAVFHIKPTAKASIVSRQAAVYARWLALLGIDNVGLRQMVYPLLKPTTAFWDRCDDGDVSFRYTQILGNGTITETTSPDELVVDVANTVNGEWNATYQNAPRCLLRVHDLTDEFWFSVQSTDATLASEAFAGICVYQDALNAVGLEIYGGSILVRAWRLYKGVLTQFGSESWTPQWLQIHRSGSTFRFYHGASEASLAELATGDMSAVPIIPRHVGIYASNAGTHPQSYIDITAVKLRYARPYNNIEIIDLPVSECPSSNPEYKFFAFIHREPTDNAEDYNIKEALRLIERVKPARSLIRVGHEDCFKTDDAYSLCDRDILGS